MQKKKMLIGLLLAVLMVTGSLIPMAAQTINSTGIMINNRLLPANVPVQNLNGVIMVPAREYAEALGGSFSYDRAAMSGTIKLGENELVFRLDSLIARHNGKNISAPAPMAIIRNRFMIPAELVAQRAGAEVYMSTGRNLLMIFQSVDGKLVYNVMPGDSFWIISRLFGTTIDAIRQLNGLTSDMLLIGQRLVIKNFTPFNTIIPAHTTSSATLRSGAGFGFSTVAHLQASTDISVVGKDGDWYKVITPRGNGYIYFTVMAVKQDMNDNAVNSTYFNREIPVDTSKNFVTYADYIVKSGDSIWAIAERSGIPDYELARANNLTTSSILQIGQRLKVPVYNIAPKETSGPQSGEILDWFKEGQYVFPVGKVGTIIDPVTGKSFAIQRTMGANHADCETLTVEGTRIMREIFGGSWTWDRKALILSVDGRNYAVSASGMPHAGVDGQPYLKTVSNRSDNWGTGPNLDRISGNGMDGHFCLYFLNSIRHKDNGVDPIHQFNVLTAGGLQ